MLNVNTELIRRAQQGDKIVIGELYEHYRIGIFRYLYYRVGDSQTAEDLTSEVFIRMQRFILGFQPPSTSFQAWLFQIARNLATDYFRKADVRRVVELEQSMISTHDNPDEAVEHKLNSENLSKALEELTDDQREVIILRFIAEMPISDVAKLLNKSENAVKGLQRRALIALRDILADWEFSYG